MYAYGAGSSGEGRPYQGYPYVNPVVNDVATIDAATAAMWSSLPRKPGLLYEQPGSSRDAARVTATPPIKEETPEEINPESVKIDYDANPVVYIDLPESSGSEVAEQRRPPVEDSFVQQTIFYDQFKDRTVVTVSDETSSNGSGSSTGSLGRPNRPTRPTRPAPPVTLSLGSPSSGNRGPIGAPPLMSKEASVYGSYSTDEYQSPNPEVREFPNPPPAYSEFDMQSGTPITHQPSPTLISPQTQTETTIQVESPPRTQVILPQLDQKTKVIYCKYCGINTQSFAIKQVGFATHVLGLILFLLGLFPCTFLLYFSNVCRYKNHYCKQCSKLIAYEIPFLSKDLAYVQ